MMVSTTTSIVKNADIMAFANDTVNLKQDRARAYREQVNNLREKVARLVQDHPDVGFIKLLLSGSLAKGTALSALNDIDVALYVKADVAPSIYDNRLELLEWIAGRLREMYPQMSPDQITLQTHTVRVSFSKSGLDVDVAPVWYDAKVDKHNQDLGHLINRHTGDLVLTSIPLHIEFIRRRKRQQKQHYAQVVRLVKWWVKQRKAEDPAFRCRSFLTEMICAHVADSGADFSNYPEALATIFTFLVKGGLEDRISFTDYYPVNALPSDSQGDVEVFDPVNADNNVTGDYFGVDRDLIVNAAELGLDAISEAEFAITKTRAIECWQRVLGPSFKI